mgnify:FL=1
MKDLIGKVKKFGEEATEILKEVQEAGLKKHTVTKDDTLSSIALKYYGHATEKYWKIIYNFNKKTIGDDPNKIKPGMELVIPVLPDELKK